METQIYGDIRVIDSHYVFEGMTSCYLIVEEGKGVIIETSSNFGVPYILEEIRKSGITTRDIQYIIITHVHLDHSGGAGKLMELCPEATLLVHPRAAKHMINPSRLIQSAIEVYGKERFYELYGEILPVPENRIRIMEDGEEITFGTRKLKFLHTKGHANHHFVIYDSKTNGVFTGDTFGLAYPIMQEKGLFIIPTTSPTDFDPGEARNSIQKILDTGCDKVYLTHYGVVTELENAREQLLEGLEFSERLLQWSLESNDDFSLKHIYVKDKIKNYFREKMHRLQLQETRERWMFLEIDAELNSMGIVYAAEKKKKEITDKTKAT